MTKPINEMTKQELIWAIEGYAASARQSFDKSGDPTPTLSRIKSMINRYADASDARENADGFDAA
jgi:hypothetical protein